MKSPIVWVLSQYLIVNKPVRPALKKEHASALEEGKADILGVYWCKQLLAKGVS